MLGAYPGIRGLYRRVAQAALALRPRLELLPLREAFLESLVRASLGADSLQEVPGALKADVDAGLAVLAQVQLPAATVEDSAEAALRLYEIAARTAEYSDGRL